MSVYLNACQFPKRNIKRISLFRTSGACQIPIEDIKTATSFLSDLLVFVVGNLHLVLLNLHFRFVLMVALVLLNIYHLLIVFESCLLVISIVVFHNWASQKILDVVRVS